MRDTRLTGIALSFVMLCILVSGCTGPLEPERGTLQFTSSPPGAEIYLDNEYRGTTPGTLTGVETGNHTLEYRYPGYMTWTSAVSVSAGISRFYAALSPESSQMGEVIPDPASPAGTLPDVTILVSKDPMIIGESIVFSGSCTNSPNVTLTLFGPGTYSKGIVLAKPKVNAIGLWSYTWYPGTKIQAGSYTVVAHDARNISSAMTTFKTIGGGLVTVVPGSYATAPGSVIRFSGRCTTNADNVRLVLFGPGRFSAGIELGTVPVLEDDTWSYRYVLESAMPTGTYSVTANDVPKTTSATSQFTVGFTS